MPKISQGRLDGISGMEKFTSQELFDLADEYDRKISDPTNTDDPKWLKRRSERLRKLASKKEKSLEHKNSQSE